MSPDGRVTMLGRWQALGRSDRLELYLQATLYGNIVLVPLLLLGVVGAEAAASPRSVATTLAVIVHVVLCGLLMRSGIAAYLGRGPRTRRLVPAAAASAGLAAGAAVVAYPQAPPGQPDSPAIAVLALAVALFGIAWSTVVRSRTVLLTVGPAGCAAIYLLAVRQGAEPPQTSATTLAAILLILVPACRVTLWTLGMVRELERTRRAEAVLAVAGERLRFARDLHDVLGRSLSVVAVKAELAARLSERGRAGAADEMREVRRIAQEALAELREVVDGHRAADLGTELAGARALLASAGIECRVEHTPEPGLPEAVQQPLGWAVREATTNVLRHSEAKWCAITLRGGTGAVTLTIENDGTPVAGPVRLGNGLTGLTERIGAVGGTVTAGRGAAGQFRLSVTVPRGGRSTPGTEVRL